MKKLMSFTRWLFGIIFIIYGLVYIQDDILLSIVSLLLGLFIIPTSLNWFQGKLNYMLPTFLKYIIVIIGISLIGVLTSRNNEIHRKNIDAKVQTASIQIDKGNIDSAKILINQAKAMYSDTISNNAIKLENEINNSTDKEFAKEVLGNMTDDEFKLLTQNKLSKPFIDQQTLNKNFYKLLVELIPLREELKKKAKIENEKKLREEEEKLRNELIQKQFSSYDGSHRELEKLIKNTMNDADSYEHVKTVYEDKGDYIIVETTFRGNNAFGAKVINTIKAKVDFYGNIIEVVSNK